MARQVFSSDFPSGSRWHGTCHWSRIVERVHDIDDLGNVDAGRIEIDIFHFGDVNGRILLGQVDGGLGRDQACVVICLSAGAVGCIPVFNINSEQLDASWECVTTDSIIDDDSDDFVLLFKKLRFHFGFPI